MTIEGSKNFQIKPKFQISGADPKLLYFNTILCVKVCPASKCTLNVLENYPPFNTMLCVKVYPAFKWR